jgi:hypothetical protein
MRTMVAAEMCGTSTMQRGAMREEASTTKQIKTF